MKALIAAIITFTSSVTFAQEVKLPVECIATEQAQTVVKDRNLTTAFTGYTPATDGTTIITTVSTNEDQGVFVVILENEAAAISCIVINGQLSAE